MNADKLRCAVAVAASSALLMTALAAPVGAKQDRVTICHKHDTKAEKTLKVAKPALLKGHMKHGDYLGKCGKVVLAIAYTDLDGVSGFGANDVAIAKFVDADGSGTPTPGDSIEMGRYPRTAQPPFEFGTWASPSHEVKEVHAYRAPDSGRPLLYVRSTAGRHMFSSDASKEYYQETDLELTSMWDSFGSMDILTIQANGGSGAGEYIAATGSSPAGDDDFIEIDIR
jgi:hypothetical protein